MGPVWRVSTFDLACQLRTICDISVAVDCLSTGFADGVQSASYRAARQKGVEFLLDLCRRGFFACSGQGGHDAAFQLGVVIYVPRPFRFSAGQGGAS